ncbi:MAG: hypothetical protein FD123_1722 [Bacteroidetes bacterium]|nr:MAG: hypothetical protein FD123_1722 [Bacteroidota bacterium]
MDFSQHPVYIPLSSLTEDLKENGFVIGVDTWENVYRLLRSAPFTAQKTDTGILKASLCPLFAVNEEQQAIFYRLFDKHFGVYDPRSPHYDAQQTMPAPRMRKNISREERRLIINYSSLGVALLTIFWFAIRLWFYHHPIYQPVRFNPPRIPSLPQAMTPDPPDTARTLPVIPQEPPREKRKLNYLSVFDPDPSYFEMKDFWKYRFRILFVEGGLWIVLGGCSVWMIVLLYRRKRQRLIKDRQDNRDPLSYWPIRTEERIHVQLPHEFFQAANSLRRRLHFSSPQLDMESTVLATIIAGGRPSPRFRQRSRPAEYLVLLPDDSAYSMFTQYCEFVFGMLGKTDIVLHRYFYSGPPELFYANKGEKPVTAQTLLYHHGNARLLLVMHPVQAEISAENICMQFRHWDDRALLFSTPAQRGTPQDNMLREDFLVFPASVQSLAALVDQWEQGLEQENETPEPPQPFISRFFELKKQLHDYFAACNTGSSPDDLLQWLAACCLYPELHWDLVLFTGKQIKTTGAPLLRLENLEALCRINWFASGTIPAEVRDKLIHDESILPAAKKDEILKAITELVEQNMPQEETSLVYDRRKLHLALLDALLDESEKSRRKRMRDLVRAEEQSGEDDAMSMLLLERHISSPLGRVLGEKARQNLYRDGKPYKGWKTVWTTMLIAVVATGILLLIDTTPVTGNLEAYNGKAYFIDNAEKQATWQNHKASFFYNPYYPGAGSHAEPSSLEHKQASALIDSSLAASPGHPVARFNRFIRDFNYELMRINDLDFISAGKGLKNKEAELETIGNLLQADSIRGRDSLMRYYTEVKSHYWFARWMIESAAGNTVPAEDALKKTDTGLLDEVEKYLLENLTR